jgi:FtsP/CotA-like multicopper oxidase with cupredoxin domain
MAVAKGGSGGIDDPKQFFAMSGSESKMSSTAKNVIDYDVQKHCAPASQLAERLNPTSYLTYFNCGHVTVLDNGTTLRQFALVIREDIKVPITLGNPDTHTPPILYNAWTFNGSIPAPTIRVTQGDHVSIKVINEGTMAHSFHMHSIHPGSVDGTMFNNASGAIKPGDSFTYNFVADPVGLWPFHCHMMPISMHITKGLYGHMIIDPPANAARPAMHEMNMIMNGFDLGLQPGSDQLRLPTAEEANQIMAGNDSVSESLPQEHDNQVYALNTVAFYYDVHPIPIKVGEPYRVYLTNMLDFDFANTFHLHGQVFQYYPSGTAMSPMMTNDIVSLPQGDRGILEFTYHMPGLFMIHSHFESQAARGWEGLLNVQGADDKAPITPTSSDGNPNTHTSNGRCSGSGCK